MLRRLMRKVSLVTVLTYGWGHRGSVVRGIDVLRRLPRLLMQGERAHALLEVRALASLDAVVPARTDLRVTGIGDGVITVRGDTRDMGTARRALLRVPNVLDVRTDGQDLPTVDEQMATQR